MLAGRNKAAPSVYLLPPVDVLSGSSVSLTCFVKDFYPKEVLVEWSVDNVTVSGSDHYSHHTTNVVENNGLYSTYGQLTFSPDSWTNGREFRCKVYHESLAFPNTPIVRLISDKSNGNVNIINLNLSPYTCLAQ